MQSTKPPGGTRDFLPEDIRRREYVIGVVRRVYERYGFEPLETPAFENIETLLGKYGEEGNKLIFKILRRGEHESSGEADLALRYDLTVPLARVVAQYQNQLPKFFKRYQIQPVWRADRPAKGRFREFFQCDIDSIGSTSPVVEAEILGAVAEILTTLGFQDFSIRLNHRRLLTALLEKAGVPEAAHGEALIAIDKLDKIGEAGVTTELMAKGLSADVAGRVLASFATAGHGALAGLGALVDGHAGGTTALEALNAIVAITPAAPHIKIDPSLARGLSYYTGAIMEIAVTDLAGSLGGGGRYDNLIGMFLGRDVPACGFSLGLERIIVVMTERKMFPPALVAGAVDVVVTFMDDDSLPEAIRFASDLRSLDIRAEVHPEVTRKFDKALKAASGRGAKFMAVIGENERTLQQVSVRDLVKREPLAPMKRESAAKELARLVGRER
jgi:histidyl-tRNA synthetase